MDIKEKVKDLPRSPGVYLMKDAAGRVLYVGKADDLRARVSSYFRSGARHGERITLLVSAVNDIAHIPTSTSAEALIYENSLIKQLSPKYNVALRDDKSYPLLKLTVNEKFPRLIVTRQRKTDGARYFGPYTNAKLLRQAVTILKELFPLRTCVMVPKRVCLAYHIKQCPGPCEGMIDVARYAGTVKELELFLGGRRRELLALLTGRMDAASACQDFEEAGRCRDRIESLCTIREDTVIYGRMGELDELASLAGLSGRPRRIEGFDISNVMGQDAVGALVVFVDGRSRKSEYRKYRIRSVAGIDDYGMMREVVRRRFERLRKEPPASGMADLVLIDGGKGHLGAVLEELEALGFGAIPVIGIAKEHEHIYVRGRSEPLVLPRESKALNLLRRVRDEAHRFAIGYHNILQSKRLNASELDGIPLVGEKRKRALVARFGSVARIRSASVEELRGAESIDAKTAQHIFDHFRRS